LSYAFSLAQVLGYYTIQESNVVFLLAGGDKSSQEKDIEKVDELLKKLED